jgi:transposase
MEWACCRTPWARLRLAQEVRLDTSFGSVWAAMQGEKRLVPKLVYHFTLEEHIPADHLLRRVAEAVDFGFVRERTARFYRHTGQPGIDPVVLFKLGLLGYLYGLTSERRLAEACRLNLACMWFLGYDIDEPTPDHSVLSKARARCGLTTYQAFFTEIVRQCERAGLVQGDRVYVDRTLVRANASLDSLGSRALVEQQRTDVAAHVAAVWRENEEGPIEATGGAEASSPNIVPLPMGTAPEPTVAAAPVPAVRADQTATVAAVEPMATPDEGDVSPRSDVAVGGDDRPGDAAARGPHPLGPDDPPNGPQGPVNVMVVSRTDPDAGLVARDGVPLARSHKLHVGVDGGQERIITAVDVTAGEVADEDLLDRRCKEHQGTTGMTRVEVVADAKDGVAANSLLLEHAGILASIPLHQSGREHRALPRSRFPYDAERDVFVCPAGQWLTRQGWSSTAGTSGGIIYRASPSLCRSCPRKLLCCGEAEARTSTRTVEEDVRERARASVATAHAKTSIRRRKTWAESAMAELKERHGCRRASGRGRTNVRIQALLAATADNVKKLARSRPQRLHEGAATAACPAWRASSTVPRHQRPRRHSSRFPCASPARRSRCCTTYRSVADFGNRPPHWAARLGCFRGGERRAGARAAEVAQEGGGVGLQPLDLVLGSPDQRPELLVPVVVAHPAPPDAPALLQGIGRRVVRGGVDQAEGAAVPRQRLPHPPSALRPVREGVVDQHDRRPAPRGGALDQRIQLEAKRLGVPPGAEAEAQLALAPVGGAEADELLVPSRRPDRPLAAAPLARPDAGEGGVERRLDLILDVEIGVGEERQQGGGVLGQVRQELRQAEALQPLRGRGRGRSLIAERRRQEQLRPQAFPAQSSRSWALRSSVQVGRLQT